MVNFNITESTSHKMIVMFDDKLRLYCVRHSDRRTGDSVWETWFERYGTYKTGRIFGEDIIETKWGKCKGTIYKGVKLGGRWSYKKEILAALEEFKMK